MGENSEPFRSDRQHLPSTAAGAVVARMSLFGGSADACVIREAVEADLPVLVDFMARLALHVSGAGEQTLKEKERERLQGVLRQSLTDPNKLLVVADVPDAGVVGMGYVYLWRSQGIWEQAEDAVYLSGIIDDVWVEPDFRNRGIFRAMMRELVAFAERQGVAELVLEYSTSNKEAAATWSRLGFTPTGVRAAAPTATVREALSGQS